ncbi:acetyltransferase [Alkalihalobacillus sp. LMS39]|uniref:acetyltransferase n=1 Tax=Alkalihalobacillus sp. LMS39 TaxID=2924032 RepID=UPI001FB4D217|nr:acetyltransferase [Alkalihalobacillus sp. LMS39]UOE95439.1 acetyltransferase [Alkalihalobacillus sp. LMS39]
MRIIVIGHGGHSKVIRDIIEANKGYEIVAYVDDKFTDMDKQDSLYYGPLAAFKDIHHLFSPAKVVVAIGNNKTRKKIVQQLQLTDDQVVTLVHPSAVVSPSATIGSGTVVMANVTINASVKVGSHVIVNTNSVIEHDSIIEDYVHISPNATAAGTVEIKEGVQLGVGASVIPNVTIGEWTIVGAGAAVVTNLPSYTTAVGVPAKIIGTQKWEVFKVVE